MYLRDAWYVAAVSSELTSNLLPVRILEEDLVLCRQYDGIRAAFEKDRAMLNAILRNAARSQAPHTDIAIDAAPLRFRRSLQRLTLLRDLPNLETP